MVNKNMPPQSSIPTDDQWSLLQPLLSASSLHRTVVPDRRGRPPLDDRLILAAIFWKIRHDLPWYDLPPQFPSHQTVYRRYRQWRRLGLWGPLMGALLTDLETRGGFEMRLAFDKKIYQLGLGLSRWTVLLDPAAPLTWQVETGWVFAWLIARRAYRLYRDRSHVSHASLFDLTA